MLARCTVLLVIQLSLGIASPMSHADPCAPTNGATSLPELAHLLLRSFAQTEQTLLSALPVDECAWRRAEWLLGQDRAADLAKLARDGRLNEEREDLRQRLALKGLTLPAPIGLVEGPSDDGEVEVIVNAQGSWIKLEFYAVEIDGRWYLAKHRLSFYPSRSASFLRFRSRLSDLSSNLSARSALEAAGAKMISELDAFEKWNLKHRIAAIDDARRIAAAERGDVVAAKAEVLRAFVQLSDGNRVIDSVSSVLRELADALGVPKWDFAQPTGDRECDRLFAHTLKCAKSAMERGLAVQDAFRWLEKPAGITCLDVLAHYGGQCEWKPVAHVPQ